MDRFVVRKKKASEETRTPKKKKSSKNLKEDTATSNPDISNTETSTATTATTDIQTLDLSFSKVVADDLEWRKIKRENLDLDYTLLLPKGVADGVLAALEEEVDYFTGDMAQVKVFGKWHNIPRKQATYGDPGLSYKYSGKVTPARPWPPTLAAVRDLVCSVTGFAFNFVLINRYQDGRDKMGEHKDDERELHPGTPIASLSLGQARDFYFRHQDTRPPRKLNIEKVQLQLQHGSLLLMNPPTNRFWYHALPPRSSAGGVRVNLTFRRVIPSKSS